VYGAYFYVDRVRFRYQFYNDDSLAIEPGSRFYWGHAANVDYDIYNKIVERPFDNQTRFSLGGGHWTGVRIPAKVSKVSL